MEILLVFFIPLQRFVTMRSCYPNPPTRTAPCRLSLATYYIPNNPPNGEAARTVRN
jgi:hypothetical protein